MASPMSKNGHFVLYAADLAFLIGMVMALVLFAVGYVADALVAGGMMVVGAAYSLHQGQPWPGHAFVTYWKQ